MKLSHFEAVGPVCPVCRSTRVDLPPAAINIQQIFLQQDQDILQGILLCSNADCSREFPIIDGIPFFVADLQAVLANNLWQLGNRHDLAEPLESLLGDASGPGSSLDLARQHLSAYAWDHYAEFDPQEAPSDPPPGNVTRLIQSGWQDVSVPNGVALDLGCATGRSSFELAAQLPESLVVGIDLNLSMLRLAGNALRTGRVRYSRRRIGMVYDRREFPVVLAGADRVDFWAADVGALPCREETIACVQSLNVLDCLADPWAMFQASLKLIQPGGYLWLTTPFDWNPAATPVNGWIGGHSQRGPWKGDGVALWKWLLEEQARQWNLPAVQIVREFDQLPWRVRCHDRSRMDYSTYGLLLQRTDDCHDDRNC